MEIFMDKQRILYIMGIDWEWIYQRPQILAEKLSKDYQVTVVFPRSIVTRNKHLPDIPGMEFRILWTIPYQEKNKVLGKLSEKMNEKVFADLAEFQYIYIGYPLYGRYIPDDYSGKVVYDCMDNHEALYPDQKRVAKVLLQENRLIERCDVLLASAKLLQNKVDNIAGYPKSILIRNGVEIDDICEVKQPILKKSYSLCYVGTISEWFDYEAIQDSLNTMQNIDYHLIGPADRKIEHDRVIYHGQLPHEELGGVIRDYDCLIMPFRVNEIVASVDPVKLYEYIAFGKCIVSVYYPEIERFGEFVYFYKTEEEYVKLLQQLEKTGFPPKYNTEQQREFLKENTWDRRYELLRGAVNMQNIE